eukprot:10134272-Heterocapsa_arctica.AAC.1
MLERVFDINIGLKLIYIVQNDKRSARNQLVIARMPEDCSTTVKTFKHLNNSQTPSKPSTPVCVHLWGALNIGLGLGLGLDKYRTV